MSRKGPNAGKHADIATAVLYSNLVVISRRDRHNVKTIEII